MQEAKKNVILRVFRTAHCPPGKYFFGVTCSALSVLLSGVPFYTKLGDGGHKLSGGEAQRIAIARAILKDAPIVVLDEAMAFTDAENELALREGMAELLKGKTVLMIAHRLYSIQDADCIFVLENGKLREHGSHTELLKANGLYAHLWAIQNETESWQMKGGPAYV